MSASRWRPWRRPPAESTLPKLTDVGCFWACLGGAVGGACGFALAWWGGDVGRGVFGALGFGAAGFLVPFVSEVTIQSENQWRFAVGLGAVLAVIGAAIGATTTELPWWAWALGGSVWVAVGAWLARRLSGRTT